MKKYLAHQSQKVRNAIANEVSKRVKSELANGEKYTHELWLKHLSQVLNEYQIVG